MYNIYIVKNLKNGRSYIGQTCRSLKWRFQHHCCPSKSSVSILSRAIQKYGRENFSIELLHETDSIDDCNRIEEELIAKHQTIGAKGYNILKGGDAGGKHPEWRKKALSIRMQGERNPFFGRRHSDEAKRKIGEQSAGRKPNLGRKFAPEMGMKISASKMGATPWNQGKPWGDDVRAKIKEKARCRAKPVYVRKLGTNEIIYARSAAELRDLGMGSKGSIGCALRRQGDFHRGVLKGHFFSYSLEDAAK